MPQNLSAPGGHAGLHQSEIRGLAVTPTAPLPFLRGVAVRSFVLQRVAGNVIIYNAPGITAAKADIMALGRPERLLVNHWHEAMYGAPDIDVPIFVHEDDRGATNLPVAGTFAGRQKIGDDLELIPTPGHTAGTTMVLWDNGEHRVLFPGDSIWVQAGDWKAVLLGESSRSDYIASLLLLMDVDFDFLAPWGAEEGQPYACSVTRAEARDTLQRIVDRLRAGKNG